MRRYVIRSGMSEIGTSNINDLPVIAVRLRSRTTRTALRCFRCSSEPDGRFERSGGGGLWYERSVGIVAIGRSTDGRWHRQYTLATEADAEELDLCWQRIVTQPPRE